MTYTRIPENTFSELQLNAGILVTDFDPATGTVEEADIFGATDGGANFTAIPTFRDNAEGIDNAPTNTKELKVLDSWEVKMSGTLKTLNTESAQKLLGAGDVDTKDATKVTARVDLKSTDFIDLWWVGDYGANGGFIAIKLINALSTGGFSLQSSNKEKGAFAFEFTGHTSISAQNVVPFELYIKS